MSSRTSPVPSMCFSSHKLNPTPGSPPPERASSEGVIFVPSSILASGLVHDQNSGESVITNTVSKDVPEAAKITASVAEISLSQNVCYNNDRPVYEPGALKA